MSNIVYDYIEDYIRSLLPKNDGLLKEMEDYALKNHVPIVQPEVAGLLSLVIKSRNVKHILEVGTAIGYSSISMHSAAGEGCSIVTIERDNSMAEKARYFIEKAGLLNSIKVVEGEAEEVLSAMDGSFDMIFLDAAKGQYMEFFKHCHRLLKNGGILFADNVLFRGMVATNELLIRRKITIVKRLRKYLKYISENRDYASSVLPVGDGVLISLKIGGLQYEKA